MTFQTKSFVYVMEFRQWNDDSYYLSTNYPTIPVTIMASTQQEAVSMALIALGPADRHHHWRVILKEIRDARLEQPVDTETPNS